jgi:late competence protein required for DNA uptake (superfamily II DNA/RNA helicase)
MRVSERGFKPSYKVDAKVVPSLKNVLGQFNIISPGRVKCPNCGNDTYRAVVDYNMNVHLYCTRCNCELLVYLGDTVESLDEAD